jgi:hypothetical protein
MQLGDEHPFLFLIHDRDTKFSHAFDEIFRTEGIKVIRTPIQAPNANAHAERWVRTLRAPTAAITTSTGRTARSTSCRPMAEATPLDLPNCLRRRDLLGGLIHEYQAA